MPLPSALLPDLPALLVIAEEAHFGRAADRLNVSQPRVSQVVKRVEDIVGYAVFARRPRVRLTPAGELLTRAAREALDELATGLARAEDAAAGRRGVIRLGYAPVAMMTKLPRLIKSFHERNPLVELELHTSFSANLWADFEARKYDLIVSRECRERPGVRNRLFAQDGFVVALPAGDQLARRREISMTALAARDFIASDDKIAPQWHALIFSLCRSAGFQPNITQRTNDWGATLALVASGLGVSIVSSTLAQISFPGVEFTPLKGTTNAGTFWLSCHEKGRQPLVRLLLEALVDDQE